MSLQQNAIRAASWTAIQNWGEQAFGFIVFVLLARLLEPESFGLVAYATALIGFMQVFVQGGMGMAIVQRSELHDSHLDTAFWYSLSVGAALCFGVSIGAQPIAGFLGEPELVNVLRALSWLFVLNALADTQAALLRRKLQFGLLAARTLIASSLGGAAGVTAAFAGLGVYSLVIQQLVNFSLMVVLLWSWSGWRPHFHFSLPHFRELFAFGGPVTLTAIFWAVADRADRVLIGRLMGPAALGAYAVGSRGLQMIMQLVTRTMSQVGLPVFARLQLDPERMRTGYLKALRINCLAIFPACTGLIALSPGLVPALFGPGWEAAIPVMQVLSALGMTHAVQSFAAPVMNAMGKPSWVTGIAAVNAVLTIVGVILAAPFGLTAVAFAILIRGVLVTPLMLLGVHLLVSTRPAELFRVFAIPLVCSTGIGVAAHLGAAAWEENVGGPVLVGLGVVAFACALLYVALIRVLARPLFDEAIEVIGHALPARWKNRLG